MTNLPFAKKEGLLSIGRGRKKKTAATFPADWQLIDIDIADVSSVEEAAWLHHFYLTGKEPEDGTWEVPEANLISEMKEWTNFLSIAEKEVPLTFNRRFVWFCSSKVYWETGGGAAGFACMDNFSGKIVSWYVISFS